jgi:hypothetical protein
MIVSPIHGGHSSRYDGTCYLKEIVTKQISTFPRADVDSLNVSLESVRDSVQQHEEELSENNNRLKNDRYRSILQDWLEPILSTQPTSAGP